jgi:(1->4)-alpha-D-glucan 1-alpha-D-glucosylmutase
MLKAAREAKERTSWINPDEGYEAALQGFVTRALENGEFLKDLTATVARVAHLGLLVGLSQALVKVASPGVPDYYQGTELWDFSLVDPDNRRPVDFERRARLLDEVERGTAGGDDARHAFLRELVATPEDGRLKLHVIRSALAARRERGAAFRSRIYLPLEAAGRAGFRVVAFGRGDAGERLIAVVPRRLGRVEGSPTEPALWADTVVALPTDWPRRWSCALSGRSLVAQAEGLPLAELFAVLPVALLLSELSP